MRKYFAFSTLELIFIVCLIVFIIHVTLGITHKTNKLSRTEDALKLVHSTISEIVRQQNNLSPIDSWGWENQNVYEASDRILMGKILPYISKKSFCDNPLNCVGGYTSMDGEEYVNYRQKTDYARALVGKEHIHIALKATGYCKKRNPKSLCGILVVDIDNKDGNNKMGDDVFMFGFYGDGSFMPYGYELPEKEIDAGCTKNSYGDKCAARIMNDNWRITYDNFQ